MGTLFISHAAADKPVVDALYDLLQTGCDLRTEMIRCTSVDGAGIETGSDFVEWINKNLADADLVVLLLSPNYYESKFCLAELGAAWALGKEVFPIVLPGVPRDPGIVLVGRQSAELDGTGLDELRDRIAELVDANARSRTSRWNVKRGQFLKQAPEVIAHLPEPEIVDRLEYQSLKESAEAAYQLYEEAQDEIRELRARVELLEEAKDPAEVRAITAAFEPAATHYEAVRKELLAALDKLSRVEQRAAYASIRRDSWVPGDETWSYYDKELEKAVKSAWLLEDESMDGCKSYEANREHPRMEKVFELLAALGKVISTLPEDVLVHLQQEEGYLIDLENWEYWDKALLKSALLE